MNMEVLRVILRVFLKLGTCTIGGGLVAWIAVGRHRFAVLFSAPPELAVGHASIRCLRRTALWYRMGY